MIIEKKQPNYKGSKGSWTHAGAKGSMSGGLTSQHFEAVFEVFYRVSVLLLVPLAVLFFGLHFFAPQVFR